MYGGPDPSMYGVPSSGALGVTSRADGLSGVTSSHNVEEITHGLSSMRGARRELVKPMGDESAGARVKPPIIYELTGAILDAEMEDTNKWITDLKQSWLRTVLSIMSDNWHHQANQKDFLNFLAYCPRGTTFMSSRDVTGVTKDAKFLTQVLV
ncbi:hypothetical protein AMTR_s00050p00204790 [Amborella trichopoda]|uniref:DUF659 domain-containing protein n=1 Tax=Amborella trichopoda TaxID=13333 RepID=W1PY97_AMBTC|nr:hypothetical protein AMTR_s00050p00204790 [Amborella trichopoda]